MARKRLVDCSVRCNGEQLDFNVRPYKNETVREACLRKARGRSPRAKSCEPLRHRLIDGLGRWNPAFDKPPQKFPRVKIIREE